MASCLRSSNPFLSRLFAGKRPAYVLLYARWVFEFEHRKNRGIEVLGMDPHHTTFNFIACINLVGKVYLNAPGSEPDLIASERSPSHPGKSRRIGFWRASGRPSYKLRRFAHARANSRVSRNASLRVESKSIKLERSSHPRASETKSLASRLEGRCSECTVQGSYSLRDKEPLR